MNPSNSARIVIPVLSACSLAAHATDLSDQAAHLADAEVESVFWHCDFAATRGGVGAEAGAVCATITDELFRRRFLGDYSDFVAWWHANKQVQRAAQAEYASRGLASGRDAGKTSSSSLRSR